MESTPNSASRRGSNQQWRFLLHTAAVPGGELSTLRRARTSQLNVSIGPKGGCLGNAAGFRIADVSGRSK